MIGGGIRISREQSNSGKPDSKHVVPARYNSNSWGKNTIPRIRIKAFPTLTIIGKFIQGSFKFGRVFKQVRDRGNNLKSEMPPYTFLGAQLIHMFLNIRET